MNSQIRSFKIISTAEAISFLVLLLIAMPLKYIWNEPAMVTTVGYIHGFLFIAYVVGAFVMFKKLNWTPKQLAISILCSVLPFGPFYVERKYLPQVS